MDLLHLNGLAIPRWTYYTLVDLLHLGGLATPRWTCYTYMNLLYLEGLATPRGTCYTVIKKYSDGSALSKDATIIIISVAFCFAIEAFCYLVTSLLLLCHKPSITRKAWQGMIERTTRSVTIQQLLSPTFSIGLNTCFVVIWLLLLTVFVVSLSCFFLFFI